MAIRPPKWPGCLMLSPAARRSLALPSALAVQDSGPAVPPHCGLPLVTLGIYDELHLFTFMYLLLADQIFAFHWTNILSYILLYIFQKQLQLYFKQQMFPFVLSFLILFLLFIKSLSTALVPVTTSGCANTLTP